MGKTALSIKLAQYYHAPIVSADGRQFYKEMNIGTAKPSKEELSSVPHYLIDHISVKTSYNIGQFEKEAMSVMERLFQEHSIVFLVGGSGLYINAICHGVDEFEEIPEKIRVKIQEDYQKNGIQFLQEELKKLDEVYYNEVDLQNPQRLIRALEVCYHTGKPFSSFRTKTKKERPFDMIPILINTDREILYNRINQRVDQMIENGLLEEVKQLLPHRQLNALNTVGYKELFDYLDQHISFEEAVYQIKQNTRRYAKRQLTWFRNQGEYEEFGPNDFEKIKAYIDIIQQN